MHNFTFCVSALVNRFPPQSWLVDSNIQQISDAGAVEIEQSSNPSAVEIGLTIMFFLYLQQFTQFFIVSNVFSSSG